jgi:hypothetical protein
LIFDNLIGNFEFFAGSPAFMPGRCALALGEIALFSDFPRIYAFGKASAASGARKKQKNPLQRGLSALSAHFLAISREPRSLERPQQRHHDRIGCAYALHGLPISLAIRAYSNRPATGNATSLGCNCSRLLIIRRAENITTASPVISAADRDIGCQSSERAVGVLL